MAKTATIKTGVIGHPVGHSLSPLIHETWIRQFGFPARYDLIDIPPEKLESGVEKLVEDGYIGFNVTIPYKQDIIQYCARVDETARRIGAVNTVIITDSGQLVGMNTDSFGFVENMLHSEGYLNAGGETALVLGAGGAARAVVHGLLSMGYKNVKITNRTRQKAEEIAAVFPVKVIDWDAREKEAGDTDILVNTTALGMTGQPPLDFDVESLPPHAAVCDIVYRPLMTQLLKDAQSKGHPVITGIGMLLHQARPAFKEWYGMMPAITPELQQKLENA